MIYKGKTPPQKTPTVTLDHDKLRSLDLNQFIAASHKAEFFVGDQTVFGAVLAVDQNRLIGKAKMHLEARGASNRIHLDGPVRGYVQPKGEGMNQEKASTMLDHSGSRPILVAVDFTEDSKAALLWACSFAEVLGAPVKVLHVVHDPGEAPGYYRQKDEDLMRPMEDVASELMTEFLAKLRDKHGHLEALLAAEPLLVKGIPATRILEAAEQNQAQLIVMGSRGRTGLEHLLLGSKAERVVQLSPIPVTIVKAPQAGVPDE